MRKCEEAKIENEAGRRQGKEKREGEEESVLTVTPPRWNTRKHLPLWLMNKFDKLLHELGEDTVSILQNDQLKTFYIPVLSCR